MLGIKNKEWLQEFLLANYAAHTVKELAEISFYSIPHITAVAKSLGLTKQTKKSYNENFFKTWSHNMAYVFGFILADGYLETCKNKTFRLTLSLHRKDRSVLEFIRQNLSKDCVIRDRDRFDRRTLKTYQQSEIKFSNTEICRDLIDFGVLSGKTGKEVYPDVPQEFKYSFLCGVHDGDGHLGINEKEYKYYFQFACASRSFLESINDSILDSRGTFYESNNCTKLNYYGKEPCMELDRKMTEHVSFYLKRKHFQ